MRNFLSLGGGVQSTAMLLMALHGEFDVPLDGVIFSDTGAERAGTYENIEFLREYTTGFGVPFYVVSAGNLRDYAIMGREGVGVPVCVPFFILNNGHKGMLRRQCTSKFKVRPINKKLRELGATAKSPVASWIGISVDEAVRMKPSRVKYAVTRFPLVDNRISRNACYKWLEDNGFTTPVRSSCTFCPYHTDTEWRSLSDTEFAEVVEFEKQAQWLGLAYMGNDAVPYLHSSLTPISERPFDTVSEGQLSFDLKTEECEGGCFL